jgi:signal transduction histidine kinase
VEVHVESPDSRPATTPGETRSLSIQARLIAVVCVLADVAMFTDEFSDLPLAVWVATLVGIVAVDGALALSPKYSGQLAVAFILATIGLACVLRMTPDTNWILIGSLVASYRAGAWLRPKPSGWSLVGLAAATAVGAGIANSATVLSVLVAMSRNVFIPWLLGRYTSSRRRYIAEIRLNRELELRDIAAEMDRAADRLRSSIARDLHDTISHHVSAISVHTGAARLKLEARPDATAEVIDSLSEVEASTRSAMQDLRRVLDVLHKTADSTNQVGLKNLEELFDGVRRSGQPVRFRTTGAPQEIPPSVDIALYRIVQEMLTNALRHGDGSAVEIELGFTPDTVTLSSRNGIGPITDSEQRQSDGRGLAGIRGRVALFGGDVAYGADSTGLVWETRVTVNTSTPTSGETQ